MTDFPFPAFYNYPPYFTLQPVNETQQKQRVLWKDLILKYCRQFKVFLVSAEEADEFALFTNKAINRRLNREAKITFLGDLIAQGNALWLDPKLQRQAVILWKSIPDWANTVYQWARAAGIEEDVVTLDEISTGDNTRGTELEGLHREVLVRALKVLEAQGRAKLFKGASTDDEGVKFFAA